MTDAVDAALDEIARLKKENESLSLSLKSQITANSHLRRIIVRINEEQEIKEQKLAKQGTWLEIEKARPTNEEEILAYKNQMVNTLRKLTRKHKNYCVKYGILKSHWMRITKLQATEEV